MKPELKMNYYPGDRSEFLGVDEALCIRCGKCRDFCARGVWKEVGNTFRPVHTDRCAECGACWNICPVDAVKFGEPCGGTGVFFIFG
jgi:NAD-dependent dihydropyrimidine dehydrogenase PreA subunit